MIATFGNQYISGSIIVGFSVLLVEFTDVFDVTKSEAALTGSLFMGISSLSGRLTRYPRLVNLFY